MTAESGMLSVDDVRGKARKKFERHWPRWVAESAVEMGPDVSMSVKLKPPSEKQALADLGAARAWVREWSDCSFSECVEWAERRWSAVGTQHIPYAVRLNSIEEVAAWAGETELLACAELRAMEAVSMLTRVLPSMSWAEGNAAETDARHDVLAERAADAARAHGSDAVAGACSRAFVDALRRSLPWWCELPDADWGRALSVMEWLLAHPGEQCYARQLPIRGVDTKWVEKHGRCIRPLVAAATGDQLAFKRPPKQFRCKALDERLAIGGIREMALSAEEFDCYPNCPDMVIVCENLVSMLCLEDEAGLLAVHGSGFAVAELAATSWLSDVPVLYWGDLDSNGFAILNTFRSVFPHVRSVLMDESTLAHHRDLCVVEEKPFVGELTCLTGPERKVLALLLRGNGSGAMRLEQERVEWDWACRELRRAYEQARSTP